MSIVRDLVQRADSWVNAMTGLGTLRDKLTHTQVAAGQKLEDSVLEALFNDDDIARRVVAKLPREATRRGFRLEIQEAEGAADEPDDAGDTAEPDRGKAAIDAQAAKKEAANVERQMLVAFTKLEAMPRLRDGWIWARLYGGGSGVFVGADDGQDVAEPLNESRIRSVSFLNIVKRPQLSIERRYEDLQSAEYGKPELYRVHQAGGPFVATREGLLVHESRLILFDGAMTAQMTNVSATGFDDSVLQSTFAPLQQTASAWQSVAHLMTDASQGVLKIANLVDLVASGGQETLRSRIQLMDLARSVCRSILVDAEKESFERVATSFAGLPEVMDKLMMRMGAAAEQPVTLLYGRSAAGLNATGESDIRGWYDTVAEAQSDELKPRLERLLRLMFLAADSPTGGVEPEQWTIVFEPLWQPTDKEKADTKKVVADTYVALVGANIMTDMEAGLGLAPDFPTLDVESRLELDAADKAEGARPREVNTPAPPPGLEPGGDGGDAAGGGGGDKGPDDGGDGPKGREDSQPRVPAGSPEGGQFASSGGAGAGTALASAQAALTQKLVARYGVPAPQAARLWERDLKAQLTARRAMNADRRLEARALAGKSGLQAKTAEARKKLEAKKKAEAEAAKKAGEEVAKKAAEQAKKAAEYAAKKKASAEKAKATKAANKQKKLAELAAQKQAEEAAAKAATAPKSFTEKWKIGAPKAEPAAGADWQGPAPKLPGLTPVKVAKATPEAKATKAALATAKKHGMEGLHESSLQSIAAHGKSAKLKAAAAAMLESKGIGVGAGPETLLFGSGPAHELAGHLQKGGIASHTSQHATPAGIKASEHGPLTVAPSPHRAAFEAAVEKHATSFKVIEQVAGSASAEKAHSWKKSWVGRSTQKLANEVNDNLNDPAHPMHAQYHATQALLKKHLPELQKRGIVDKDGYVTLYRGVKEEGQGKAIKAAINASPDGSAMLKTYGVSSWSASHRVARKFALNHGAVLQQRVHISNAIVVHNFEPKWKLKEIEWTLVAPKRAHRVVRADESRPDLYH